MKLGHVHLKVDDLEEAVSFYRSVIKLEVRERTGRYVFMSATEAHHQLALQDVAGSLEPLPDRPGLYHIAFEVDTREELATAAERARQYGTDPQPVDHGISESLYLRDPARNGVEIYRDTRGETGRSDWGGQSEHFEIRGGKTDD